MRERFDIRDREGGAEERTKRECKRADLKRISARNSLGETAVFEIVFLNNQQQPDHENTTESLVIDTRMSLSVVAFVPTQTATSLS